MLMIYVHIQEECIQIAYQEKCTRMFIRALSITASPEKPPICPSIVKWVKCATATQCNATQQEKMILTTHVNKIISQITVSERS